jgi:hypothetical protein
VRGAYASGPGPWGAPWLTALLWRRPRAAMYGEALKGMRAPLVLAGCDGGKARLATEAEPTRPRGCNTPRDLAPGERYVR